MRKTKKKKHKIIMNNLKKHKHRQKRKIKRRRNDFIIQLFQISEATIKDFQLFSPFRFY